MYNNLLLFIIIFLPHFLEWFASGYVSIKHKANKIQWFVMISQMQNHNYTANIIKAHNIFFLRQKIKIKKIAKMFCCKVTHQRVTGRQYKLCRFLWCQLSYACNNRILCNQLQEKVKKKFLRSDIHASNLACYFI